MKVLLADSDAKSARAVFDGLRAKQVEVVVANDAVRALAMARDQRPDAVLLSARLAGGARFALRRIRSNVFTTHLPIVAMADAGFSAHEMIEAGAQECLFPPVAIDALLGALERNHLVDLDFTRAPRDALEAPERIADLRDTGLLDSAPEAAFDRLTSLASRLLGAPTALVSLVDSDRQFFKSHVGLEEPWAGARQTPLSHSFCQWVASANEAVVVEDAKLHPVLASNLAIRDLQVVAYAGVPLAGRCGQPIGSLCAIDSRPRRWSPEDLDTLEHLSRIARAYAVLNRARGSPASPRPALELEVSATVAGHAALGAVRLVKRRRTTLDPESHEALLSIIEDQAEHLTRAA